MEVSNLRKSTGLTLVELLIVLAIAAILAQIALPDFSDIMKNNRSATRINELQTSLNFARSEAIKRNNTVVICQSTNGTTCEDSEENWQDGWIIFADQNGNDSVDSEELLTMHGNADDRFTLTFTETRIEYAGLGLATQGTGGTFTLCHNDEEGENLAKGVIIGPGGRPQLADVEDLDCGA
jgi:type IV fimbrial biogenesis protein FimT